MEDIPRHFVKKNEINYFERPLAWLTNIDTNKICFNLNYDKKSGTHAIINTEDRTRLIQELKKSISKTILKKYYYSAEEHYHSVIECCVNYEQYGDKYRQYLDDKFVYLLHDYQNIISIYDDAEQPYPQWFIQKYINKNKEDIII